MQVFGFLLVFGCLVRHTSALLGSNASVSPIFLSSVTIPGSQQLIVLFERFIDLRDLCGVIISPDTLRACTQPLGLSWDGSDTFTIPDSAFYSPANLSPGGGWEASAMNARLYYRDDHDKKRIGAWCAQSHDQAKGPDGYVQVDLGQTRKITHIATQGRDKYFERVSKFKIACSSDGSNYSFYKEGGKEKVFDGNCDHFSPILNKFKNTITARYMRYYPVEWNFPCVRMEFYGC